MGKKTIWSIALGSLLTIAGYGFWSFKEFEKDKPLIFPAEVRTAGIITHQFYLGDYTYSYNTTGQNNMEWDYAVHPSRILQSDIGNQIERQKAVFSGRIPVDVVVRNDAVLEKIKKSDLDIRSSRYMTERERNITNKTLYDVFPHPKNQSGN